MQILMLLNVVIQVKFPMVTELDHHNQVHFQLVRLFPTDASSSLEEETPLVKKVEYGPKDQPAIIVMQVLFTVVIQARYKMHLHGQVHFQLFLMSQGILPLVHK